MKTTVDIPDELLKRARDGAKSEGASLSTLIEAGLRVALAARQKTHSARFSFPTFGTGGLSKGGPRGLLGPFPSRYLRRHTPQVLVP